jgi:hypothetical protein
MSEDRTEYSNGFGHTLPLCDDIQSQAPTRNNAAKHFLGMTLFLFILLKLVGSALVYLKG